MCRPQGETLQEVEGSKRLHIAKQMPLPLTISCSSKSRLVLTCLYGFTFLVPAHPGGPGHIPEEQ